MAKDKDQNLNEVNVPSGTVTPAKAVDEGPVIDITRFQQLFQQKSNEFLAANSSQDNQPKTFNAWMEDFYDWAGVHSL